MLVTKECSTVVENLSRDPKIGVQIKPLAPGGRKWQTELIMVKARGSSTVVEN
jgi:hypothetical protein